MWQLESEGAGVSGAQPAQGQLSAPELSKPPSPPELPPVVAASQCSAPTLVSLWSQCPQEPGPGLEPADVGCGGQQPPDLLLGLQR